MVCGHEGRGTVGGSSGGSASCLCPLGASAISEVETASAPFPGADGCRRSFVPAHYGVYCCQSGKSPQRSRRSSKNVRIVPPHSGDSGSYSRVSLSWFGSTSLVAVWPK